MGGTRDAVSGGPRRSQRRRAHVRVEGVVQGVGFRPHIHLLATELGLGGVVGNDADGVFVEVEGAAENVGCFLERLRTEPPPLATIERLVISAVRSRGQERFEIVPSTSSGRARALVAADVATCTDCLAEVADPFDRRAGYAFANCTNCGPRYTIVRDVPYDRATTTMAAFPPCAACAAEYDDPGDRRFHAQPVCCPACGPRLELVAAGAPPQGDPIAATAALLAAGRVVAIKGIGGYHLAADATAEDAVARLRSRKHREEKPFAVMVADTDAARRLCRVGAREAALLEGREAPIVLLARREGAPLASAVAPGNRRLGLMLPYTPLHHLLLDAIDGPLVLTSGNVSDEPIAHRDDDARARLSTLADAFLRHDRGIHVRVDDSVGHVVAGRPQLLRRSRGYAPHPVRLAPPVARHILGTGAELKSTVCLARGEYAFVSPHLGDLENYETFGAFVEAIEHLGRLFDIQPEVVAHDLHPEYLSTKHAVEVEDVELVAVQHHHAHIASCLADNGEAGPVIGLALDGTGLGTDDTLWGGEVLVADLAGFERVGHLGGVPMPGGTAAIREPWRMALAHLDAAFDGDPPGDLDVVRRNAERWDDVLGVVRAGVNSPVTSSAGRLFDAVAALVGIRDTISYEGQAAIELEQRTAAGEHGHYPATLRGGEPFELGGDELIRAVVADLRAGTDVPVIAARFHATVAELLAAACGRVRDATGIVTVALSGGVFQNVLLCERLVAQLGAAGHRVLTHRQVPPNDGGISLGQVAVAAAQDRRR